MLIHYIHSSLKARTSTSLKARAKNMTKNLLLGKKSFKRIVGMEAIDLGSILGTILEHFRDNLQAL